MEPKQKPWCTLTNSPSPIREGMKDEERKKKKVPVRVVVLSPDSGDQFYC